MSAAWSHILEKVGSLQELAGGSFDDQSFAEWLEDRLAESGFQKREAIRRSALNQTFAYQIFAGTRSATRDKLIQLAFGLGLGADDSCELLERGGAAALSPRSARDTVIAFCLESKIGLSACDDALWDRGLETILPYAATRSSRRI